MRTPTVKCAHCGGTGKMPDSRKVGAGLRLERKRLQIGLREMALRLGMSSGYLHDLENGRRDWTPENIEKYKAQLCL